MKKVAMISLGCPKNQVDGEMMLAKLQNAGFYISPQVENTDVCIINTCGFIDDAKTEAIETILSVASLKKEGLVGAIVVTGCLSERYKDEVTKEMPEIDGIIGIGANDNIVSVVNEVLEKKKVSSFPPKTCLSLEGDRLLTTPKYFAYLKISEGCSNCCTYCAIPLIRGKFRSRNLDDIVNEARGLAENGVKEIVLVGQDVTKYGLDNYGKLMLATLLTKLCQIDGIKWIRLLYCYPESITEELIDVMAREDKICKYIDIPMQHADESVLKRMNRKGSKKELLDLVEKLRKRIPEIVIRTTLMTGFPGESEENFETLSSFVNEARFDRLGCFSYSAEEGTLAAKMDMQLDEEVKKHRAEIIMQQQYEIFSSIQESKIGKIYEAIVEGYDENDMLYYGRTYMDCAEIDSRVIISTEDELLAGSFVKVKIIGVDDCDLVGEIV